MTQATNDPDITMLARVARTAGDIGSTGNVELPTLDGRGTLTQARYQVLPQSGTAIIDAVGVLGTGGTATHPLDTYGLGVLLADAATRAVRTVVLVDRGLGATDCGLGLALALAAPPLSATARPVAPLQAPYDTVDHLDMAQLNVPAAALRLLIVTEQAPLTESAAAQLGVDRLAQALDLDAASLPDARAAGGLAIVSLSLAAAITGTASSVQDLVTITQLPEN